MRWPRMSTQLESWVGDAAAGPTQAEASQAPGAALATTARR